MVKAALQPEDIMNAIEEIAGSGLTPTYKSIRQRLGRGSNSQIGPVLREWQHQNRPTPQSSSVPVAVIQAGNELLDQLWRIASETQQMDVAAERRYLQEQALMNETAVEAIEAENVLLTEQLVLQQESNSQLQVQKSTLQSQLNDLTQQLQVALVDRERLTTSLTSRDSELEAARVKISEAVADTHNANSAAEILKIESTKLESQLDVVTKLSSEQQQKLAEANFLIGQLRAEIQGVQAELIGVNRQIVELSNTLGSTQEALLSCQRENIGLEQKNIEQADCISDLQGRIAELNGFKIKLDEMGDNVKKQNKVIDLQLLEIKNLQKQHQELSTLLDESNRERRATEVTNIQLNAKLETMKEMMQSLGGNTK
jgi:chromosome segregation ATPase